MSENSHPVARPFVGFRLQPVASGWRAESLEAAALMTRVRRLNTEMKSGMKAKWKKKNKAARKRRNLLCGNEMKTKSLEDVLNVCVCEGEPRLEETSRNVANGIFWRDHY